MIELLQSPVVVPLGAFVTAIVIVIVEGVKRLREREVEIQRELRVCEMEHLQRMRELDAALEGERKRGVGAPAAS